MYPLQIIQNSHTMGRYLCSFVYLKNHGIGQDIVDQAFKKVGHAPY
jgi:hypothetical protein